MRTRAEVEEEAKRLPLTPGTADWKRAVYELEKGWPAWRVAQLFKMDRGLIARLGGPSS